LRAGLHTLSLIITNSPNKSEDAGSWGLPCWIFTLAELNLWGTVLSCRLGLRFLQRKAKI